MVRGLLTQSPFMGEEKPDEEPMGKDKSSPRLSTTYEEDVDTVRMNVLQGNYTCCNFFVQK